MSKEGLARFMYDALGGNDSTSCGNYISDEFSPDLTGVTMDGQFDLVELAEKAMEYIQMDQDQRDAWENVHVTVRKA